MTITHRDTRTATSTSTPLTIDAPVGVQDGDFLVLATAYARATSATGLPTVDASWTLVGVKRNYRALGSYAYCAIWVKIANNEPATYEVTGGGTSPGMVAICSAYSGVGLYLQTYSDTTYTSTNSTIRAASVTTGQDNEMLVAIGFASGGTFTPPTDFNERGDVASVAGSYDCSVSLADFIQETTGASGNKNFTYDSGATAYKHAYLIAIADIAYKNPPDDTVDLVDADPGISAIAGDQTDTVDLADSIGITFDRGTLADTVDLTDSSPSIEVAASVPDVVDIGDARTYRDLVLASVPLLYYRLNETVGVVAADSSGNNLPGTYVGSPTLNQPSLIVGDGDKGIALAGSVRQCVYRNTNLGGRGLAAEGSVELWVQDPFLGIDGTSWLARLDANNRTYIGLNVSGSRWRANFVKGSPYVGLGDGPYVQTGSGPHHCVLKWWTTGGTHYGQGFFDGVAVTAPTAFADDTDCSMAILGAIATSGTEPAGGRYDEFAVYARAISDAEILAHYQAGISGFGVSISVTAEMPLDTVDMVDGVDVVNLVNDQPDTVNLVEPSIDITATAGAQADTVDLVDTISPGGATAGAQSDIVNFIDWTSINAELSALEDVVDIQDFLSLVRITAVPPPSREWIKIFDQNSVFKGVLPAYVEYSQKLEEADTLDTVRIAKEYINGDGTVEDRWWMLDEGWMVEWRGARYTIDTIDKPTVDDYVFQGTSIEVSELNNFLTNYGPGGCTYLNRIPTDIGNAILTGKIGRVTKNGGFGILDANNLPTNWTHPTGWTSQLVTNRLVWQADAGTEESVSDEHKCRRGISYEFKFSMLGTGAGTAGIKIRWKMADGSTVDSAVTNGILDGTFHENTTAQFVALGNSYQFVLFTSGRNGVTQFDDILPFEIGPSTGWTFASTMDTRVGDVLFDDGAWQKYGVWTTDATSIYATTVGDYAYHIFNGSFVTVHFGAGGAGAKADVYVNNVLRGSAIDVSSATTYSVTGLDPSNDHFVEIRVNAVKVVIQKIVVSTDNIISMRWDFKPILEAIASIKKAVGGELWFDTINRVIHLDAQRGSDKRNTVNFSLRDNLTSFDHKYTRTRIINDMTFLGYGEGDYQLVVNAQATSTNSAGQTSIEKYGIRRGTMEDKECKVLATAQKRCQEAVEETCWEEIGYDAVADDDSAALVIPGDTARFEGIDLRITEIQRDTDRNPARLTVSTKPTDAWDYIVRNERNLAALNKSYQGVPTDTSDTFWDQFERTSGGTDVPAEAWFYVPYGADLIDLRIRYKVDGMRSFAKATGAGGGATSGSGGSSTPTSSSGGSSTPTSSSESTPSGGGSTSGSTEAPSGGGSTSGSTSATAGATASVTRNPAVSSTYFDVILSQTSEMVDPTGEVIMINVGNFTGGTRSFSWQLRTAAGGGGSQLTSGSFSNLADGALGYDIALLDDAYGHTDLYLRMQMSTAGDGSWMFNGTRTASFAHTHTTPSHTHPNHTHTTPNHTHPEHTHTVSVPAHTHTVTIASHTHTIPDHTHDLSYGIYESSIPATVRVSLDDVAITALNDIFNCSDFSLLPYVSKDSNGRVREGWHKISFVSATNGATGSVKGSIFAQKFLSTEGI